MRVALDTHSLYVTRAGTSRYVRGLQRGLRELNPAGISVSELAWPVENFGYRQPGRAAKTLYREAVWAPFVAPEILRRQGIQLLHRTTPSLPIGKPGNVREIVTLHDLSILRFPERFRRWQRWADARRLSLLFRADRIICDSRFTADEAIKLLGLQASRLEVIPLGHDFDHSDTGTAPAIPGCVLPAAFFLFVGSLEPGKNLALLKHVYAEANERGDPLPALVIVGSRWPGVANEGAADRGWCYLGYQPDSVLAWLYHHALALVFPSRYEGFGLPVLEAMAMGCPVICSRVASLEEVGGGSPLYSEMTAGAYGSAMRRISDDEALRKDLSLQGLTRARKFSWRECAAQTVEVYRTVAG